MHYINDINFDLYDLYIEACISQINKLYDEYEYTSHILLCESVLSNDSLNDYLFMQEAAKSERDNKVLAFIRKMVDAVKNLFKKIRENITALLKSSKERKALKEISDKIEVDPKFRDITISYIDYEDDIEKINDGIKKNDNIFKRVIGSIGKKTKENPITNYYKTQNIVIMGKAKTIKIGNASVVLAKLSRQTMEDLRSDESSLEVKYNRTIELYKKLSNDLIQFSNMNDVKNMKDTRDRLALIEEQRKFIVTLLGEESEFLKKKAAAYQKSINSLRNAIFSAVHQKRIEMHTDRFSGNQVIQYKDIKDETIAANVGGAIAGIPMNIATIAISKKL